MATECTQEAVLQFLLEQGGRVKNQALTDHFKAIFPEDPEQKATVREQFKGYVDNVAFVKLENGVKNVCLKKKYRRSIKCTDSACNSNWTGTILKPDISTPVVSESLKYLKEDDKQLANLSEFGKVISYETIANRKAQQEISSGSGYGTVNVCGARPTDIHGIILEGKSAERTAATRSLVPNNNQSDNFENVSGIDFKEQPKLIRDDLQTSQQPQTTYTDCATGDPTYDCEAAPSGVMSQVSNSQLVNNHRSPTESQNSLASSLLSSEDGADESQYYDLPLGMSGSDSPTTKGRQNNFLGLSTNSSSQVRCSRVLRTSVYLSAKHRDSARNDADSISQVSSMTDEDGGSVTLDPLEHEWMMCASEGKWGSLHRLLSCEPNLITKKDFVTGFTCLHWAAKQGKQELLALMVNFAKQHTVPININARSSAGYTPLHLAAMHNHVEVVKLLVGAYDADIEARDYSGKKACQYLTDSVALDIRDIVGAGCGDSDPENTDYGDGGRWRLSKVLQSSLPLKLLSQGEEDPGDGAGQARQKPVRRKSSLSRMKPNLQKIRFRSSQIVHSTSFTSHCEAEELEGSRKSSFKSRPLSSLFG
ncbi:ankyrin repeat domain-containing protein SOWAHC [Esox lucius]|uniref:SOWAHA-C winged helix-turn-helix domain-containing protein n=1 Tax=Esox lucius TaxID=8010 RepID=A0A3P8YKA9_ESOLU|nr:ankyrin repeat domain-containing protein SOWAHC [Esox lucius]